MTPENNSILPDWTRREPGQTERQADLNWIAENLDVFWSAAQTAFEDTGRGAILVDTTVQPIPDAGHPFGYFLQEQLEEIGVEDVRRMVAEYDPDREFVIALLKSEDRISTYRLWAPDTEQSEWDWQYLQNREAALAVATEAEMQMLLEGAKQLDDEGAPLEAQKLRDDAALIQQRLSRQHKATEPNLTPPDLETLMEWEAEGGCEAACPHGCWTEPDGTCPHGNPSWLLKLGLI